jgi:DNA transformation protein
MDRPILRNSLHLFAPLGKIKSRSMFGGFGIFADDNMFALTVNDTLFIRANPEMEKRFKQKGYKPYVYKKKGFPVVTKYFALPQEYWDHQDKILKIGARALRDVKAAKIKQVSQTPTRLKDLPNLRLATERMLKKAGIHDANQLRETGALNAFKAIKESQANVNIELLWALEGAIKGSHWSVVPIERRNELLERLN